MCTHFLSTLSSILILEIIIIIFDENVAAWILPNCSKSVKLMIFLGAELLVILIRLFLNKKKDL